MDDALSDALGDAVVGSVSVERGYTHNRRRIVTLASGRRVFVKESVDDETAAWLRTEHTVYDALVGQPFMAQQVSWLDGPRPALVLEDLSSAQWPPPWTANHVEAVLDALKRLSRTSPPPGMPRVDTATKYQFGWPDVLRNPTEFLALGLCSADWLDRAGPTLAEAAANAPLTGARFLHNDMRSDNICFVDGRAIFVDWNLAGVGNPAKDVAFWLPSLAAEGGPTPETVAPDLDSRLAALVAGFFAARAGQPKIDQAPRVREVQLTQLRTALPWAARCLGLPQPDRAMSSDHE